MKIYSLYFGAEIFKAFLLGTVVFISIISMTQFLQLSEFILIHNVATKDVAQLGLYMVVSFLPIVLPMSLLFAILMSYSRLAADSEIIALNSLGYSRLQLISPALLFSLFVTLLSGQFLFTLGPLARFQFDKMLQSIGSHKIVEALEEKTFMEDFFGMMIYFTEKGPNNEMKNIFIRDLRNRNRPIIITAKSGFATVEKEESGQKARIELREGRIMNQGVASPVLLNFENYSLSLLSPSNLSYQNRDYNTYDYQELKIQQNSLAPKDPQRKSFEIEIHRRWSLAAACLVFGLLGAAQGVSLDRRAPSSRGFILSVVGVAAYWIAAVLSQNIAEKVEIDPWVLVWLPNLLFLIYAATLWRTHIRNR